MLAFIHIARKGADKMASTNAASLDYELAEQLAVLSPTQKRELIDFASFLAFRRHSKKRTRRVEVGTLSKGSPTAMTCPLDAIAGIAIECTDTDLSINHDKYLYGNEDA